MSRKLTASLSYRGSKGFSGNLEVDRFTVTSVPYAQSNRSVSVNIVGAKGKLGSVYLVMPETLAAALAGALSTAVNGLAGKAEVSV